MKGCAAFDNIRPGGYRWLDANRQLDTLTDRIERFAAWVRENG
jgi:hypothetical protein